ncbi:LCP family protein [Marmoricola sp. RAF53]|uniref:LCP family protein n=1 Tax=Marmoricola sp. RAF53 TaxID=3233059 RepID=UPI003F98954E
MPQDENPSTGSPSSDPGTDTPAPANVAGGIPKLPPLDLEAELAQDGPTRTAPLFDRRPAALKNPAELPEPGERKDLTEAIYERVADDLSWLEKPVPSDEEQAARQARKEAHKKKVRSRRRKKRIAIGAAVAAGTVLVLSLAWFAYVFGGLSRMPSVHGQTGASTPGTNYLLIGTNPAEPVEGRAARAGWRSDLVNSDLVMLVHVTADGRSTYVISIPGDSAVKIPGHGFGKLSDAFKAGGAPLYVRTVEEVTGARLDRVMTLDLNALREIVDVLDGVVADVPAGACDDPAGPRRFDGQGALDYIALQDCMPRGDLDRVARQQSLFKAIMRGALDGGTVTHPFRVNRLLHEGFSHLTVEDDFSYPDMLGTLWSMRRMRTSNTTFLTVPTAAAQPNVTVKDVDYVRIDDAGAAELWQALRTDRIAEYIALSGIPTT